MDRLGAIASSLVAALGVIAVILLIVVINGGYVWRSDCATSRGTVKTSYSYSLYQLVPYLAPSESGCSYYSGTRVIASAIGFWKIPDANGGNAAPSSSPETAQFVAGASDVLDAISKDWQRQLALQRRGFQGLGRDEAIARFRTGAARIEATYERAVDRLERLPDPSDDDLTLLRTSLTEWLRLQLAVGDVLLRAIERGATSEELERDTAQFLDDFRSNRTTLLRLRAVLPSRYPELDNWVFLQ
jgi:hypothetical protein